jgi:hypothetical protein
VSVTQRPSHVFVVGATGSIGTRVVFEQGDTGDGGIGRDQLAEVLVHSLLTDAAIGRTFEPSPRPAGRRPTGTISSRR